MLVIFGFPYSSNTISYGNKHLVYRGIGSRPECRARRTNALSTKKESLATRKNSHWLSHLNTRSGTSPRHRLPRNLTKTGVKFSYAHIQAFALSPQLIRAAVRII